MRVSMGSAKKFFWIIFLLVTNILEQPSLSKSPSVPTGFRARMFHRGYSHLSPLLDHYNAMLNHSVNRLHYFGNVLTEDSIPVGYIFSGEMDYIVEVGIGMPPVNFNLSIDTGSHIIWAQHEDFRCINKTESSYNDKSSYSAREISCNQKECDEDGIIQCNDYSDRCSYKINYDDGTTSSGTMFLDSFTFSSIDGIAVVLKDVRFGAAFACTEGGFHHSIQGVFGLSRNSRSFIFQRGFNKFSYCIPSRKDLVEGSSDVASNIRFGTEASLIGKSTTMTQDQDYYIASLNGISVGGMRLWLDPSIFKQPNGRGRTVVDTGTPISFMPGEAFDQVVEILVSMIHLPTEDYGNAGALCFKGGLKEIDQHVPNMTLHFEGLDLPIIPRSVFFVVPTKELICLAMQPTGYRDKFNIFGSLFQQSINIGFDMGKNKIFMSPMTCTSII